MQGTGAQDEPAMQQCPIQKGFPTDLEILHDRFVHSIESLFIAAQPIRDVAKTDDGKFHRSQPFQIRCSIDQGCHVLRQGVMAHYVRDQSCVSRLLDDPGQLERIKAPRLLKAIFRKTRQAAKLLIQFRAQVRGYQTERLAQEPSLPHDSATALNGDRQPRMRVQRHRIGAVETDIEMSHARIEDAKGAIGSVYMQPEPRCGAEVGQGVERIYGTGIDGPCASYYTERAQACLAVSCDRRAQG